MNNCFIKTAVLLAAAMVIGSMVACCEDNPTKPPNTIPWTIIDQGPTWSPDGKMIAYEGGGDGKIGPDHKVETGLYIVDLATRHRRLVLAGNGRLSGPHWSPDGDWIGFSLYADIWKITAVGDSLMQLTSGESGFSPRWSPDGRLIAFDVPVAPGGTFLVSQDGDSVVHLGPHMWDPDWFPDGNSLAVQILDSTNESQIGMFRLDDSMIVTLTDEDPILKEYIRVSPDGSKILYTAQETEVPRLSLYTVDVNTKVVQKIVAGASDGSWSPDGRYLAYTDISDGAIYVRDLIADTVVQVSPGMMIHDPDWDSTSFPKAG